jgi:hypothetical protein
MECVICYEVLGTGQVTTDCGHKYCVPCFSIHIRKSNACAYCRTEICDKPGTEDQLLQILDNCLEADSLCDDVKNDIIQQCNSEIASNTDLLTILDNIDYSRTIAIVSHWILETASGE